MKLRGLLAVLVICTAMPAFAREPETGFLDRTLKFQGNTFHYQVYVPANFDRHEKWPVILFLHGRGESGYDGLLQTEVGIGSAIRRSRGKVPFIVVMPQCPDEKSWTDPDMGEMALAALHSAVREFHGDANSLSLTGISMGGYGTWEIAAHHPGTFAAIVPVCAGLRSPKDLPQIVSSFVGDPKIADPYAEVAGRIGRTATAVWIFHGTDDGTVPVEESRKMAAALRAAGGTVKYTEYPGTGHNSWDQAYAEPGLFDWLLKQHFASVDTRR